MIVNKFAKKCQSCNRPVGVGEGFAYRNGNAWFTVCASTACHRRLGVTAPTDITGKAQVRKISVEGYIHLPFDRDAIPLLKSMPGARFYKDIAPDNPTPGTHCWAVSVKPEDLPRVLEVCEQLELEIPDALKNNQGTEDSQAAIKRIEELAKTGRVLYNFQKTGVEFLSLHKRALLADDMGLGKSPVSLVALPENIPVIIICPASLKYNWRNEINIWRPEFKVTICKGKDSFVFPKDNEIVIINYDILPSYFDPTKDSGRKTKDDKPILIADLTKEQKEALERTVLICDEAHLLKNFATKRSRRVGQVTDLSKKVWFLTGTPLENKPLDLFGVLSTGNMNPWSFKKFVQLFNGYKNEWGGYVFGMPSPEVPERLKRICLRRLKSEVLKDLPPKTYKDIQVEISPAIIKQLDSFLRKISPDDKKKSTKDLASKLEQYELPDFEEFSEVRTLLAQSRIESMLEIVESYEESDTPLIVFSDHVAPIEELSKRDGWKIITGATPTDTRQDIVSEFQSGKLKGLGLTIGAAGVGLTLTRASNMLFVDLNWVPSKNIQAEDRCVRIGQTSSNVLIMRMSSSHPLDVHIENLLRYKMELAYRALEASLKFKPLRKVKANVQLVEETDEELLARINEAEKSAEQEICLGKLMNVLGRESEKVSDVPEPELTVGRKEMLNEALGYMISICDGAETRDGMGFNKPDAMIARWVGCCLHDDVAYRVLERILVRYRRQLKGKFAEIWKPEI